MLDSLRIYLLQFATLLVEHAPHHIHDNNKNRNSKLRRLMTFAWPCLLSKACVDPACKYSGHLLLAHIIAKFAIHKKIVLQVLAGPLSPSAHTASSWFIVFPGACTDAPLAIILGQWILPHDLFSPFLPLLLCLLLPLSLAFEAIRCLLRPPPTPLPVAESVSVQGPSPLVSCGRIVGTLGSSSPDPVRVDHLEHVPGVGQWVWALMSRSLGFSCL